VRCPYQTISITETIKAYAIGNNDFIKTTVSFQECLKDECPYYCGEEKIGNVIIAESCGRAKEEMR